MKYYLAELTPFFQNKFASTEKPSWIRSLKQTVTASFTVKDGCSVSAGDLLCLQSDGISVVPADSNDPDFAIVGFAAQNVQGSEIQTKPLRAWELADDIDFEDPKVEAIRGGLLQISTNIVYEDDVEVGDYLYRFSIPGMLSNLQEKIDQHSIAQVVEIRKPSNKGYLDSSIPGPTYISPEYESETSYVINLFI